MKSKEFIIVMPMSLEQYRIGSIYTAVESSKLETGGNEGVSIIEIRPYHNKDESGVYTYKVFHMKSRLPEFFKKVLPENMTEFVEETWDNFPKCKTIISNPFLGETFKLTIESVYVNEDIGFYPNPFKLNWSERFLTEKVKIDVYNDSIGKDDYHSESDPRIYNQHEDHRLRYRLGKNWLRNLIEENRRKKKPPQLPQGGSFTEAYDSFVYHDHMCVYKRVSVDVKGQKWNERVENLMLETMERIIRVFHRRMFCWRKCWSTMTLGKVRLYEQEAIGELECLLAAGKIKGSRIRPGLVQKKVFVFDELVKKCEKVEEEKRCQYGSKKMNKKL